MKASFLSSLCLAVPPLPLIFSLKEIRKGNGKRLWSKTGEKSTYKVHKGFGKTKNYVNPCSTTYGILNFGKLFCCSKFLSQLQCDNASNAHSSVSGTQYVFDKCCLLKGTVIALLVRRNISLSGIHSFNKLAINVFHSCSKFSKHLALF